MMNLSFIRVFRTLTRGCTAVLHQCSEARRAAADKDYAEAAHCLLMAERDCDTLQQQIVNARVEMERLKSTAFASPPAKPF